MTPTLQTSFVNFTGLRLTDFDMISQRFQDAYCSDPYDSNVVLDWLKEMFVKYTFLIRERKVSA